MLIPERANLSNDYLSEYLLMPISPFLAIPIECALGRAQFVGKPTNLIDESRGGLAKANYLWKMNNYRNRTELYCSFSVFDFKGPISSLKVINRPSTKYFIHKFIKTVDVIWIYFFTECGETIRGLAFKLSSVQISHVNAHKVSRGGLQRVQRELRVAALHASTVPLAFRKIITIGDKHVIAAD